MRRIKRYRKHLMAICLAALLLTAFDQRMSVTEYTVYSDQIEHEVKIVLITDLHSCMYGPAQQRLIEAIAAQEPDLILMSGDIADDHLPDDGTIWMLDGIAGKYPCYYVTGNHEIWSGRAEQIKELFGSYGVVVLQGDVEEICIGGQTLFIGGVDDPAVGREIFDLQLSAVSSRLRPEQYNLLLSHRPELFDRYADTEFDLVLSGHAHGGQWRIPLLLPNGVFAPNQGLRPQYANGIFESKGTKMLVSRGLARETTWVPRIFNAPELVVVNLAPSPVS